jgi:hypothetical protein
MNLFLAIIGFYTVYVYLDIKQDLKKFILIAGGINLCFFLCQKAGFDPVFEKIPQNCPKLAGAFFGNNPRIADYFALLIPFLSPILLPLSLVVLFISRQFVILIPLLVILFMKLKNNKLRVISVLILILSAIFMRRHIIRSLNTRFDIWAPALKAFFDRPLIGYGLGMRVIPNLDALFNSYLSFIIGVGVLGLVWFGYVFKSIYKKIKNNRESIAFITLALLMFLEYPVEITRLWFLIIAILISFIIKAEPVI